MYDMIGASVYGGGQVSMFEIFLPHDDVSAFEW